MRFDPEAWEYTRHDETAERAESESRDALDAANQRTGAACGPQWVATLGRRAKRHEVSP